MLRCSQSLLAQQRQPRLSHPPADTARDAETPPPLTLPEPAAGWALPVCLGDRPPQCHMVGCKAFGWGVQTSPCSPPCFSARGLGKGVIPQHSRACGGNTDSTSKQESIPAEPPWPWGSPCPKHTCPHGAPLPHTRLFHFSTQRREVTAAQQPLWACKEHQ